MGKVDDQIEQVANTTIGAAFEVSNVLGAGFLERVYENALVAELARQGLSLVQQKPLPVHYKGIVVGDYYADLLIQPGLLVELKCVDSLRDEHLAQCLNYLTASELPLCLLFNFQHPRVDFRRVVKT